jgi:hypothetical protein
MTPFETAWTILKTPIGPEGYSTISDVFAPGFEEARGEERNFVEWMREQGYPDEAEYEQDPEKWAGGYNPPDVTTGRAMGLSPNVSEEDWLRLIDDFNRRNVVREQGYPDET